MNYKIVEKNNSFSVYEVPTASTIKTFDNKEEAKALMRKLNFGGGFDGLTPPFFLKNFTIVTENQVSLV